MTAWDIQPQGVQGQLKGTGGHAGELEKALNALVTTVSEAATAAGNVVPGYVEGDLEAAKHAQDAARTVRLHLLKDNDRTGGGR